jgi:hypothetical protein
VIAESVSSYPPLSGLVQKFGWCRVYETGLELFGYPPTWEPGLKELLDLRNLLKEKDYGLFI